MSEQDYDLVSLQTAEPAFGRQAGYGVLRVHPAAACAGRDTPCCIHRPGDHRMRAWPLNWRADTGVMERLCPHGAGHPDPDHLAYVRSRADGREWQAVHGCDGCCTRSTNVVVPDE